MRILIVKNDAVTALDLEGLLVEADYSVTGIAASANEALGMAKRSPPDLALLDTAPADGVDGIELARGLQEDLFLAHVYLTGHIEPAVLIRANHTGPVGHIVKPFEDSELPIGMAIALCRKGLQCWGESNWDDPAPFGWTDLSRLLKRLDLQRTCARWNCAVRQIDLRKAGLIATRARSRGWRRVRAKSRPSRRPRPWRRHCV